MTAAERLYAAVSNRAPDRVPVVPKIFIDSAARLTGRPLPEVLGDPSRAIQTIMEAGLAVGADAIRLFHLPPRRIESAADAVYEVDDAGNRIGTIDMAGGFATYLFDASRFDIGDCRQTAYAQFYRASRPHVMDMDDVRRLAVPGRHVYGQLGWEGRQRRFMQRCGAALACIGDCGSTALSYCIYHRGYENTLTDLVEQTDLVHALMEKGAECAIERGKFHLDQGLKVLRLNDSAANCSVISPRHWREFVFPHIKDVCDELHRYDPSARIYCHICGSVALILEDLANTGLDCIGPLDPLGRLTPGEARRRLGDRAALMGGVSTLSLVNSTPAEVLEEARTCIEGAGQTGGYVLGSGCMVPPDSPVKNLRALSEAAVLFGRYAAGYLAK